MNFESFFRQYEQLVAQVDGAFEKMKKDYPAEVKCTTGCADCCHALFDLSLVEAIFLNTKFHALITGKNRDAILEQANRADRQTYKIKREAFKQHQEGAPQMEIFKQISEAKVRCPLLGDEDTCVLYEFRPITCRVYGMPLSIDGTGRTCGRSGFNPGKTYPTINMEAVHRRLHDISKALAVDIQSNYPTLDELLVPVSMALLNEYNEEYLGVGEAGPEVKKREEQENADE